jgi:hypothetical protein
MNLYCAKGIGTMIALGCALVACGENRDVANNASAAPVIENIEDPDSVSATNNVAALATDAWIGRWAGPEGLFLDIQPSPDGQPGHYAITNKDNLDRQDDYSGVADGSTIRFVRDGKDIALRPGKGGETGFKYLADKQDCLIAIPGVEGYCR